MSLLDTLDIEPDIEETLASQPTLTPAQHIARAIGVHALQPNLTVAEETTSLLANSLITPDSTSRTTTRTLPLTLLESQLYRSEPLRAAVLFEAVHTHARIADMNWRDSLPRIVNRLCVHLSTDYLRREDGHWERFLRPQPASLPAAIAALPTRGDTLAYARCCVPLYRGIEPALEFARDLSDLRSLAVANIFIDGFTLEANRAAVRARISSGEVAPMTACKYAALQYVADRTSAMASR